MTVQLADLKNSVRVDVDTDDNLLQGYHPYQHQHVQNSLNPLIELS